MMFATLIFDAILPWWIILPSGIVFAYLSWRTYKVCKLTSLERVVLWTLRMLAFCLMVWLLAMPSVRKSAEIYEKPAVAVITDASASMEDNPTGAETTRAQCALDFLKSEAFQNATADARVYYFGVGSEVLEDWKENKFTAPRTFLKAALNKIAGRFRGDNLAAVLLLSDGLDQSDVELAPAVFKVPIYVPELELPALVTQAGKLDFGIGDISYPRKVNQNWKVTVNASIKRIIGTAASSFTVQLRKEGQVIREEKIDFAEREIIRHVEFPLDTGELGSQVYELDINPEDEESNNNRREFIIEVTDTKNRVLYIEGAPRWEFKFLKRSLIAEKNLQLSAFVKGAGGMFVSFDESGKAMTLPDLDEQSLKDYKAVILGNLAASALPKGAATALAKFVENGGGLLIMGGSNAFQKDGVAFCQELAGVMPASYLPGSSMKEGRFLVDFTPEGRVVPAFAPLASETRFPPVLSLWSPVKASEFANAYICSSDGSPLLLVRRSGQGRTAMLLSDSLWRWQMGASSGQGGKGLYGKFITQLLHWLSPDNSQDGPQEAMQILMAENEIDQYGKLVLGVIGALDKQVNMTVTTPSGKSMALPMAPAKLSTEVGLFQPRDGFRCEISADEVGTYKLEAVNGNGSRRTKNVFVVQYPEHERTGAQIDRNFLRSLAEKSGGKWVSLGRIDDLFQGMELKGRNITTSEEHSIWNNWLGLALLMALYCLEWWLRRKWDLV